MSIPEPVGRIVDPILACDSCDKFQRIIKILGDQVEKQNKREALLIKENNALKMKIAKFEEMPKFAESVNLAVAHPEDEAPYVGQPTIFRLTEKQEMERRHLLDFVQTEVGKNAYQDFRQKNEGRSVKIKAPQPPRKAIKLTEATNEEFSGSNEVKKRSSQLIIKKIGSTEKISDDLPKNLVMTKEDKVEFLEIYEASNSLKCLQKNHRTFYQKFVLRYHGTDKLPSILN